MRERGGSVVEMLIAALIGMLTTVVIFQVVNLGDVQRRTVGSGSDAQVTGNFALYTLDRDLQHSGYGVGRIPADYLGCSVHAYNANIAGSLKTFDFPLYPVAITQGAGGGTPDTLAVLIGGSAIVPLRQSFEGSTGTTKRMKSRAGYIGPSASASGDVFLAFGMNSGAQCALLQVSGLV